MSDPQQLSGALFLAALLGALPLVFRRWTERGLHAFVALAAGVFLGSIFLHLLPELLGVGAGEGYPGHGHPLPASASLPGGLAPWGALVVGFLLLLVIERIGLKAGSGTDQHQVLWSATTLGLSLHALTTGVGLSALLGEATPAAAALRPLFIAALLHKAVETFSLATVMRLGGLSVGKTCLGVTVFAAVTPVGLLAGGGLLSAYPEAFPLALGFAAGTFLYVSFLDLLPEVFHGEGDRRRNISLVGLGIALTAVTLPQLEAQGTFARAVLGEGLAVFTAMAPFLLFGFLAAGIVSRFLKPGSLSRLLARDDAASVASASIIGAPLPLCSCSVLPVAATLRQAGASRGATSAFLIATPETGVDSVTVTAALLDPIMTVVRPLAAVLSAFTTGTIVNLFLRGRGADEPEAPAAEACCADAEPHEPPAPTGFLRGALHHGFVEVLDDLTPLLLAGLAASAILSALLPESLFATSTAQGFSGLLIMLAVGIPIYVCAAASTPIAASLVLKGLSPGAALVFLLASPATNLGSLAVLTRILGRGAALVHLVALSAVTLALGVAVDWLYLACGWTAFARLGGEHEMLPAWLGTASALLLAGLMAVSLLRPRKSP